jgi:hypothetical protein
MVMIMSIVINNPNILKSISEIAKREKRSETKVLEDIIKKGLKDTEPEIPENLILNKDTYNPDHERLMGKAGIAKYGKPFSAVELV